MRNMTDSKKAALAASVFTAVCAAALTFTGCASGGASADKSVLTATAQAAQEIASPALEGIAPDTVTVSSKGSVYAVPDRAELHFGVRTQAETVTQAQTENSRKVDAAVKVLRQNGIREEDIQTTMYDVSTQYDWNTGDGTNIIGYSVYSSLSVKNVGIEDSGRLISACTEAGANEFNGISYSCTNYDELYAEALRNAVAAAKDKADTLASASGRTLGGIQRITEGYQDTTFANESAKMYAASAMGAAEDAMDASLMPGEAQISATVTLTCVLK